MTLETFLLNPTGNIKVIDSTFKIKELEFGFQASKYLIFEYGYEFETHILLGITREHLHDQMRMFWGIEPNVLLN